MRLQSIRDKANKCFDEIADRLSLIVSRAKMDAYDKRDMVAEIEELIQDIGKEVKK